MMIIMMSSRFKTILCSLLIIVSVSFGFYAETFRVHSTVPVIMQNQTDITQASLGINDALAITLPQNKQFLKGLEFEIKIPQVVAYYQGAIAWSLYDILSHNPQKDQIDYEGTKLYLDTLPGKLSYNFKIMFNENHEDMSSPYTSVLPQLYNIDSKLIFLRFQLAMKGSSSDLYNATFSVQVKPILYDEGFLSLDLQYPKKDESIFGIDLNTNNKNSKDANTVNDVIPVSTLIYIDDQLITDIGSDDVLDSIRLATGTHHLSIVSDLYRNEVRTFVIDQARTNRLSILLRAVTPILSISAPSSAKVFIDDQEVALTDEEISIFSGEHEVRFVIGDYELVKKIVVENGKTYSVGVSMEVTVSEKN